MSIYQSTKVSPYVYWLTHKTTGQFYIGYREANLVPSNQDLPIYKTSSDTIDELGFENFDFQILAEFFDGDSAYDFENRTIEVNFRNPLCLNKHYTKEGQLRYKRSGPHSEETKAKMRLRIISSEIKNKISNSHTGKILTIECKNKLAIANSGINCLAETRTKLSKISKGKNISDETKARISAKTFVIIKESDNSIYETKSLKLWCNPLKINHTTLSRTISSKRFHKGFRILEKK